MGCDIHYVVEKRVNGKWIGRFTKWPKAGFAGDRNYEFFAELAGVRGQSKNGNYPRFLPEDISELALSDMTQYGCDGHSHSWMPVTEFAALALNVNPNRFPDEWDKKQPWETLFGSPIMLNTDDDKIEDYRVIFWFDN